MGGGLATQQSPRCYHGRRRMRSAVQSLPPLDQEQSWEGHPRALSRQSCHCASSVWLRQPLYRGPSENAWMARSFQEFA